ncbi:MAG: hypothetical protein LBR08_00930, partial [Bacteroidales bacterium]|nr:hypothetical protein [Bacteroidales bacterium]
ALQTPATKYFGGFCSSANPSAKYFEPVCDAATGSFVVHPCTRFHLFIIFAPQMLNDVFLFPIPKSGHFIQHIRFL